MIADNDNDLPQSRAEAKAVGSKRYFTGKPCKHGHIEVRDTKTGACMECSRERTRKFILANPEKKKAQDKEYSAKNKEKIAANMRRWLERNPDGRKKWRDAHPDYDREWKKANPDKVKATTKRGYDKRKTDPKFMLEAAIRAGVRKGIRKGSKSARRTFDLLGYTLAELMKHLERQFETGMNWDNHGIGRGKWNVDHIIPLSAHNYQTPDDIDFKKAWSLGNLRPMWSPDNIRKHAKLLSSFQPSLALAA